MSRRKITKGTYQKYCLIIDEWFINKFNGAAAYRKYYPNVKKDATATVNFSRLQALPEIKSYITTKYEEAARIIDITKEGILVELKNWIEADITETISLTSEQIKKLPIQLRRLINKYKQSKKSFYDKDGKLLSIEENIELSFVSKERALEMINKHIGFYEADNRQKAPQINYSALPDNVLNMIWNARTRD